MMYGLELYAPLCLTSGAHLPEQVGDRFKRIVENLFPMPLIKI